MGSSAERGLLDLRDLLSEVYDADTQANNPRTVEFLEAGERLLHRDLARQADQPVEHGERPPFEEVLAWLSRRRVVAEAVRASKPEKVGRSTEPTEAAFRYRWRSQVSYLRDLVIWVLRSRMDRPRQIEYADGIVDRVRRSELSLAEAIGEIAEQEVAELLADPAFRLQMVFQATLAHDPHVADALHRIDAANVRAWSEFTKHSFDKLGLKLRPGLDFDELGCALHAAGQGVLFRAMLPPRASRKMPNPALLLKHTAMALLLAAADLGDGRTLDQLSNAVRGEHRVP